MSAFVEIISPMFVCVIIDIARSATALSRPASAMNSVSVMFAACVTDARSRRATAKNATVITRMTASMINVTTSAIPSCF